MRSTRWTVKLPAGADDRNGVVGSVARREVDYVTDDESVPAAVGELRGPLPGGRPAGGGGPVALPPPPLAPGHTGDGVTLAEVDDDTVSAAVPDSSGGEVTFREVEVEFEAGTPAERIDALVGLLVGAGARAGDPRSKVERSLALLGRR